MFIDFRERREKEVERSINVIDWLPPVCAVTRD